MSFSSRVRFEDRKSSVLTDGQLDPTVSKVEPDPGVPRERPILVDPLDDPDVRVSLFDLSDSFPSDPEVRFEDGDLLSSPRGERGESFRFGPSHRILVTSGMVPP